MEHPNTPDNEEHSTSESQTLPPIATPHPRNIATSSVPNLQRQLLTHRQSNRAPLPTLEPTPSPAPRSPASQPSHPPENIVPMGILAYIGDTIELVWHICHMCNMIGCGLEAYSSSEKLYRYMMDNNGYQPSFGTNLFNQAVMLRTTGDILSTAVEALLNTHEHAENNKDAAYCTLIEAAIYLSRAVMWIPPLDSNRTPSEFEMLRIREALRCAQLYMRGDQHHGYVGWGEIWNRVSAYYESNG